MAAFPVETEHNLTSLSAGGRIIVITWRTRELIFGQFADFIFFAAEKFAY